MARRLVVLGGSGHASVVVATAQDAGRHVSAVYDDDKALRGTKLAGVVIVGPISEADAAGRTDALIAIGCNAMRRAVAERATLPMTVLVHPSAIISRDVSIGAGTVVLAGATIQTRTSLGDHVIVNTGAIIDHDCVLGSFVHVAPGVTICGGVSVGDAALIGAGTTIVPGVRIGSGAVVGAGAVVIRDIPPGETVVGVPGRPVGGS